MDLEAIAGFDFEPRMSDSDALMWSIEKDPLLRSTIASIFLLDRAPDRERFVRRLDLVSRAVPRLRQRVVGHPLSIAPPRWEVDPNFDLHYHLRWVRAVGPGTEHDLFAMVEPIIMQGFDRARPLWEFTVIEGLADGKAAVVTKIHHSITDGVGGIKLQLALLDIERDAPPRPDELELPPAPEPEPLSEAQRLVDAVTYETRRTAGALGRTLGSAVANAGRLRHDPLGIATDAARAAASVTRFLTPRPQPLSPLMQDRSLSVRIGRVNAPLPELKAAGRLVKGRLNDAFVTAMTGGLRRYHQAFGYDDVEQIRAAMPINVRPTGNQSVAGNRITIPRFPLPIDLDDPLERMGRTRQILARWRDEPAVSLSDPMANALNRLPTTGKTALLALALRGVDMITSNVPGSPIPVYVAGAHIEAQIPFGPLSGSAVNATLLSYGDEVNVGIAMDPAAVEDPALLVECVSDSFDEVLKLG